MSLPDPRQSQFWHDKGAATLTSRRRILLGLAAISLLAGCSSFVPEGATTPVGISRDAVLKKINEVRVANGVKPLHYDTRLEVAARRQAELMAQKDSIAHELGEPLRQRVYNAGYHEAVAENLAGGQKTLEKAIEGWLNSPSHRMAMLHPYFTEMGFAVITRPDTKWKVFWATIYGGASEKFMAEPGQIPTG